jgi:hypothetical protein
MQEPHVWLLGIKPALTFRWYRRCINESLCFELLSVAVLEAVQEFSLSTWRSKFPLFLNLLMNLNMIDKFVVKQYCCMRLYL